MALRILAAARRTRSRRLLHHSSAARALSTTSVDPSSSPLRVCIVGAGPAGFYAAKYLLKDHDHVRVDMLEALPTPYGLVRSGVAPDHPEVKSVMNDFDKVAADARVSFLGNVALGHDVHLQELRALYDAVVLAYGASGDRALGIPGEQDLTGIFSARAFVNWYNGHPAFRDLNPDLSGGQSGTAVIIGQGNVAIDCARILTKSVDELATSDISQHALDVLRNSTINKVYVIGRRGSTQAAFTMKEVRELTRLNGVACVVNPAQLAEGETRASQQELSEQRAKKRMSDLLHKESAQYEEAQKATRQVRLEFLRSPVALLAATEPMDGERAPVGAIRLEKNKLEGEAYAQRAVGTGEMEEISCDLVLRSVGYKSSPIDDVPFNTLRHTVSHLQGRVIDEDGNPVRGLYCAGWLKRGPSGIIGSNIVDSRETVASIVADAADHKLQRSAAKDAPSSSANEGIVAVRELIMARSPGKPLVSWQDVIRLHAEEERRGQLVGKPREKITSVEEMLTVLFGK